MVKKIGSLIILMLWLSLTSGVAISESTSVHYEIKIDDYNSHKAYVTMRLMLNNGERLIRDIDFSGAYKKMEAIEAFNADGKTPAKIEFKHDMTGVFGTKYKTYRVTAPNQPYAILKYVVNLGTVPSDAVDKNHKGYVGNGFALFEGGQVLLAPIDMTIDPQCVSVSFVVPKGSKVITPWEEDENIFYPNKGLDQAAVSQSLSKGRSTPWLRLNDTVAIGDFSRSSAQVGGTELILATPGYLAEADQKKLLYGLQSQLAYYHQLFGTWVGSKYFIALSPETHTGQMIWAGEGTYSQGTSLEKSGLSYDMIGHQIFHRFNAWVYGFTSNGNQLGSLLHEGNNRYYEWKSVMNTAKDMILVSPTRVKRAESDYKLYQSEYIQVDRVYNTPSNLSGTNDGWFVYNKGALICIMLDDRMLLDTNEKYGLDEVHRLLFERYGHYKATVGLNELLGIIKELTGKDYSDFFSDYVNGKRPLEMEKFFKDEDGDGLKYYVERMIGTNPNTYTTGHYQLRKSLAVAPTNVIIGDPAGHIQSMWELTKPYSGPEDDFAGMVVWYNNGQMDGLSERMKTIFSSFESNRETFKTAIEVKELEGQLFVMVKGEGKSLEAMLLDRGKPSYAGIWDYTQAAAKASSQSGTQSRMVKMTPKEPLVTLKIKAVQTLRIFGFMEDGAKVEVKSGLQYSSSNKDLVKVDQKGTVTGLKRGTATVTVKDIKTGLVTTIKIVVK